jgi:hypothetical protein
MSKRQYNVGYYDNNDQLHVCFKTSTDLAGAVKRTDRKLSVHHIDTDEEGFPLEGSVESRHIVFVISRDLPEWQPCLEPANHRLLQYAAEMSDSMILNEPSVLPGWFVKLFPPTAPKRIASERVSTVGELERS